MTQSMEAERGRKKEPLAVTPGLLCRNAGIVVARINASREAGERGMLF